MRYQPHQGYVLQTFPALTNLTHEKFATFVTKPIVPQPPNSSSKIIVAVVKDGKIIHQKGYEVSKKVWAKVDSAKNSKVRNEDYIGMYEDKWFGKMDVFYL